MPIAGCPTPPQPMTPIARLRSGLRSVFVGAVAALQLAIAAADDAAAPGQQEVAAAADDQDVAAEVDRLLQQLKQQQDNGQAGKDPWVETLKAIIELGPDAVPALATALVETPTEQRRMLRSIPFVLRGIGDPRAVPALIQTLPRCNWNDGSDMGYHTGSPELLAFMRKHDNDRNDLDPRGYMWGRPVNEVRTALNTLTGVEHGLIELVHVRGRDQSPRQQHLTEHAFHRCASRWAWWWEQHWREFTDDEAYSSVVLPDPVAFPSSQFELDRQTPLSVAHRGAGQLCEPYQTGSSRVFYDLDIGRFGGLHPRWKAPEDRTNDAFIRKWAVSEGFDVMGRHVEIGDRTVFILEVIAGDVWHVPMSLWQQDNFANAMELIDQGAVIEDILAPDDDETYQNTDAYFIITRHGTPVLLRQGVEVHDTNVKIGTRSRGDVNMKPVGHFKGRRFGVRVLVEKS